jgi:hypothetical protein
MVPHAVPEREDVKDHGMVAVRVTPMTWPQHGGRMPSI